MRWSLSLILALALFAGACDNKPPKEPRSGDEPTVEAGFPDPGSAEMTKRAPDVFKVRFKTSKGDFVIESHRDWAPIGTDRFYNLVRHGWFDDIRIFRVDPVFVVQFGMSGDPARSRVWLEANIKDEPVKESNTKGMVSFAKTGLPNSRSTQIFVNLVNNTNLDSMGFAPFGRVVEGMDVLESLKSTKPNAHPRGQTPRQDMIAASGNQYLDTAFPELTKIHSAKVEK